ncbi:hypothetical protein FGO68_gene14847 [Halteria grandinella]|uniref:Uncharacterized protein n=1 Tax=Halteria grandinella TaxID=5974 RepID=A0A8J8P0T5_HALGN|nr:hypothetical protein FGO68_gene14847 [Halteria grandinella]
MKCGLFLINQQDKTMLPSLNQQNRQRQQEEEELQSMADIFNRPAGNGTGITGGSRLVHQETAGQLGKNYKLQGKGTGNFNFGFRKAKTIKPPLKQQAPQIIQNDKHHNFEDTQNELNITSQYLMVPNNPRGAAYLQSSHTFKEQQQHDQNGPNTRDNHNVGQNNCNISVSTLHVDSNRPLNHRNYDDFTNRMNYSGEDSPMHSPQNGERNQEDRQSAIRRQRTMRRRQTRQNIFATTQKLLQESKLLVNGHIIGLDETPAVIAQPALNPRLAVENNSTNIVDGQMNRLNSTSTTRSAFQNLLSQKNQEKMYDLWRMLDLMTSIVALLGLALGIYQHELQLAFEKQFVSANFTGGYYGQRYQQNTTAEEKSIDYEEYSALNAEINIIRWIMLGLTAMCFVIISFRHFFVTKWRLQLYKMTLVECFMRVPDDNRQKALKKLANSSMFRSKQYYLDLLILVFQPLPHFDPTFTMDVTDITNHSQIITVEYSYSLILLSMMFLRLIFLIRACFNYSIFTDLNAKKLFSDSYGFEPNVRFTLKCLLQKNPETTVTAVEDIRDCVLQGSWLCRLRAVLQRHLVSSDNHGHSWLWRPSPLLARRQVDHDVHRSLGRLRLHPRHSRIQLILQPVHELEESHAPPIADTKSCLYYNIGCKVFLQQGQEDEGDGCTICTTAETAKLHARGPQSEEVQARDGRAHQAVQGGAHAAEEAQVRWGRLQEEHQLDQGGGHRFGGQDDGGQGAG